MTCLFTRRRMLSGLASLGAASILCQPRLARAEAPWPKVKPVTYVVPFTPGGSTDVIGRTLAAKLSESLGQTFVVSNRPGSGGGIGATYVAGAPPDGYTLLGGTISTHAINASLYKNLSYDPINSFEPVSLVAYLPNVLLVEPALGVHTVAELIALLKRDEAKRTFASSGAGTSAHLSGELFAEMIGVPLTHVPYKGTAPALIDVSAGRVTLMFDQITAAMPLLESGRLKLLAVTTAKRTALVPDTPTMIESGVAGFEVASWQAVYAPKGTPRPIIDRLNAEIVKACRSSDVNQKLSAFGTELIASSPAELTALMAREIPRWAAVVKRSGASAS